MCSVSLAIGVGLLYVGLVSQVGATINPGVAPSPKVKCSCPKGFEERQEPDLKCTCYKFVRDLASWAEAKVYCEVIRARLVQVNTNAEHSWISNQLHALKDSHRHHLLEEPEYWLGATDIELKGYFRWAYTAMLVHASPSYWLADQPDNFLGYQHCIAIRRRCQDAKCVVYGWFDDDCYQRKFYICERRGLYR